MWGGRLVRALPAMSLPAGHHLVPISTGRPLAPGFYFVSLTFGGRRLERHAVILR